VQATLDSAPDLRRSMKKMKKIIQTISGIALGLLVSVAVFFIGQMIATQIFLAISGFPKRMTIT
jgi:cell division protein FtsX